MLSGIALGLLATTALAYPFGIRGLAEAEFGLTTVNEGDGKVIVAGGSLKEIIISFRGHHVNSPNKHWYDPSQPDWEILEDDPAAPVGFYEDRDPVSRYVGAYWVGVPGLRGIRRYKFAWNEEQLNNKGEGYEVGTYKIRPRIETTDRFKCNDFPYIIVDDAARTKGNVPVVVFYQLTARITNPVKALFGTDDWLQTISGLTNSKERDFIGEFEPDQLLSLSDEVNPALRDKENFTKRVLELNDKLPRDQIKRLRIKDRKRIGTVGRYGVTLISAEVLHILPASSATKETIDALTAAFRAKQKALARIEEGKGEAEYTRTTKKAEADGILAVAKAKARGDEARLNVLDEHPSAGLLLGTEALKATDNTFVIDGAIKDSLARFFTGGGRSRNRGRRGGQGPQQQQNQQQRTPTP